MQLDVRCETKTKDNVFVRMQVISEAEIAYDSKYLLNVEDNKLLLIFFELSISSSKQF